MDGIEYPRWGHLFLGTNQDNVDDMVRKRRHTFGTRNAMAKLNDSDVVCIRERLACGETNRYISGIFSVSEALVSQIKNGRIWKHVA